MVKPKQRRVQEAKEALQLAEQSLAQKQKSLKKVARPLKLLSLRSFQINLRRCKICQSLFLLSSENLAQWFNIDLLDKLLFYLFDRFKTIWTHYNNSTRTVWIRESPSNSTGSPQAFASREPPFWLTPWEVKRSDTKCSTVDCLIDIDCSWTFQNQSALIWIYFYNVCIHFTMFLQCINSFYTKGLEKKFYPLTSPFL